MSGSKKAINEVIKTLFNIKNKNGDPLVTEIQANNLANLKFLESGDIILTLEDRNFLYEIVWMLSSEDAGYEVTYNFLTTNWEKIFGTYNIRKMMIFENPLLSREKEKFQVDLEIYRDKVYIEEGGAVCPKCQSSSTMSITKQLRSADEQGAIVIWCTDCKYKWHAQ